MFIIGNCRAQHPHLPYPAPEVEEGAQVQWLVTGYTHFGLPRAGA
jgi:hypothetical protein